MLFKAGLRFVVVLELGESMNVLFYLVEGVCSHILCLSILNPFDFWHDALANESVESFAVLLNLSHSFDDFFFKNIDSLIKLELYGFVVLYLLLKLCNSFLLLINNLNIHLRMGREFSTWMPLTDGMFFVLFGFFSFN